MKYEIKQKQKQKKVEWWEGGRQNINKGIVKRPATTRKIFVISLVSKFMVNKSVVYALRFLCT